MKTAKKQVSLNFDPPAEWDIAPDLYVIHRLLEQTPDILRQVATCFPCAVEEGKGFMGCDGMTVEQVARAAIYKQFRRLNYRELALHTADSILGRRFMRLEYGQYFSYQTLQANIARITPEVWEAVNVVIVRVAQQLGVDNGQDLRSDATAIATNVHYPNEAQILWDGIRVACRRLALLARRGDLGFRFRDYRDGAKKLWFRLANTRQDDPAKKGLFKQLLRLTQACLNQIEAALKRAALLNLPMNKALFELSLLQPALLKAGDMTRRHQLNGEDVPAQDKIFSLFEEHTDCIVKGKRAAVFGHKVNFATGKSSLIFNCQLKRGNWAESKILPTVLDEVVTTYQFTPRNVVTDGGQAHTDALKKAIALGVQNIVFGKTRGSLQNQVSSVVMETRLKKWRAGVEADISNFKRGLRAGRCPWKGWQAFQSFVLLNVAVFNLKVIAAHLLKQL